MQRLFLVLIETTIFASLLTLWFLISYIVFGFFGVGEATISSKAAVEDVVASLAESGGDVFVNRLSRVFSNSPSITGVIDSLEPRSDGTLQLRGWAVDTKDPEQVLSVFMVVPTKAVLVTRTATIRNDVRIALRLSREYVPAGFDDTFRFKYDCEYNELNPVYLAINRKKQFAVVRPPQQVVGCAKKTTNKSAAGNG